MVRMGCEESLVSDRLGALEPRVLSSLQVADHSTLPLKEDLLPLSGHVTCSSGTSRATEELVLLKTMETVDFPGSSWVLD